MIVLLYVFLVYLCSDGIGCSGAFCVLMVCISQFRTETVVDVFRTTQIMRGQRPGIVGNVVRSLHVIQLTVILEYTYYVLLY